MIEYWLDKQTGKTLILEQHYVITNYWLTAWLIFWVTFPWRKFHGFRKRPKWSNEVHFDTMKTDHIVGCRFWTPKGEER